MIATKVALRLPEGWIEIDPQEKDVTAAIARHVDSPDLRAEDLRKLLGPLALELGRVVGQTDVILIGLFAKSIPVDGESDPLILVAHTVLTVTPEVEGIEYIEDVRSSGWVVEPVDLMAGTGVRCTAERNVRHDSWAEPVPARVRQYFVPVPGTKRLAALTFLTPNLDLADQFDEVFQAIAATLEFGYEDETATSGT